MAVDTNFKKNMSPKSNLYPLNFVKLASFSREYKLKITKVELELLTNVNIRSNYENTFIGRTTRRISHYAEANNK